MDKLWEYAPSILIVLLFLWHVWQNRIFVTPAQMLDKFRDYEMHLENKFVLKEIYNVSIGEIKSDFAEMKEKINKIYDLMIKG